MSDRTKEQFAAFKLPLVLIGAIWAAFLVDLLVPLRGLLALVPRTAGGARGIVGMPFAHLNFQHLIANTVPLLVLSALLVAVGRGWRSVVLIALLNGALLWTFGRPAAHIGASGLVYGLAGLLLVLGAVERKLLPILASVLVAVLYGGALWSGVLPTQEGVSWDGHLTGAIAGGIVAVKTPRGKTGTGKAHNA